MSDYMQLGVEIAKNLILAGPKKVTIYDPSVVVEADIGRNFYCRSSHVGKISRAEASLTQLKDLNPNVKVDVTQDASIEYM
jgi:molybdopterin/thiamine biosynthesis adenylyltransferase